MALPVPPDPRLTALVEAATAARGQLTASLQATVTATVQDMAPGSWYDSTRIASMARVLARITVAAQRQQAAVTDAYLARALSEMLGQRVSPVGPIPVQDLRGGISAESAYGRLADGYRWLAATRAPEVAPAGVEPLTPAKILARVVDRAGVIASDSVTLALRAQVSAVTLAAPDLVTGYRRVLGGGRRHCGLCIVASDRTYRRGDLMPVHRRCGCGVAPVVGPAGGPGDPGSTLNGQALRQLYQAAGGTAATGLRSVRVEVRDHGELGPTLVPEGAAFRGPDDLP